MIAKIDLITRIKKLNLTVGMITVKSISDTWAIDYSARTQSWRGIGGDSYASPVQLHRRLVSYLMIFVCVATWDAIDVSAR